MVGILVVSQNDIKNKLYDFKVKVLNYNKNPLEKGVNIK